MFLQQLQSWQHAGLIEPWRKLGGVVEYVGKPRNSVLTRQLADQLKTRFSCRIEKLTLHDGQWQAYVLEDDQLQLLIVADRVVLATPAEQAAMLLPSDHTFCTQVGRVSTLPQWVVALVTEADGILSDERDVLSQSTMLASIVCDSQKPGRQSLPGKTVWQIQLRNDWSAQHRDAHPDQVFQAVLDELHRLTGKRPAISGHHVHRWLYSSGHSQLVDDAECLWDGDSRIGVCGDYFYHPELAQHGVRRFGVESAFLSGCALATGMGSSY